jgi:hypothetical protein
MHIFLVLRAMGSLIHPFPIIRRKPIIIDPYGSRLVGNHSLSSIRIDRHLIILLHDILDIGEGCHGIGVSIDIIVFFWRKICLVIFMLEQLSFHDQPTIRIRIECLVVIDMWGTNFQVEIL